MTVYIWLAGLELRDIGQKGGEGGLMGGAWKLNSIIV